MEEIKIVIDKKEYKKTQPMVKDWKNLMEYQSKNKTKNLILDEEPLQDIARTVGEYVGANEGEILEKCPIDVIMQAFRGIDRNIVEAFTGVNKSKEKKA